MTSFTEDARERFTTGLHIIESIGMGQSDPKEVLEAWITLFQGLNHLSLGLRATYLKLEQLESEIRRMQVQAGGVLNR
jgi:hypothetical protein